MEQTLRLSYDKETDTFFLVVGRSDAVRYEEIDEHLVLRLDAKTQDVVGFTLTAFTEQFLQRGGMLELPLTVTFARVNRPTKSKPQKSPRSREGGSRARRLR